VVVGDERVPLLQQDRIDFRSQDDVHRALFHKQPFAGKDATARGNVFFDPIAKRVDVKHRPDQIDVEERSVFFQGYHPNHGFESTR